MFLGPMSFLLSGRWVSRVDLPWVLVWDKIYSRRCLLTKGAESVSFLVMIPAVDHQYLEEWFSRGS